VTITAIAGQSIDMDDQKLAGNLDPIIMNMFVTPQCRYEKNITAQVNSYLTKSYIYDEVHCKYI
jgi:hypothetical protein